jgi:Mn-dependent DtxR family transcriptional regulator
MKLSMKNIAKLYDSYDLIDYVKYENCVLTKKGKSLENEIEMFKI